MSTGEPASARGHRNGPSRPLGRAGRSGVRAAVFVALAALASLSSLAPRAGAQPASQYTKDEALILFNEARALMGEGKFDQACPKFEKAQAIDPGMGTLFNLATCYEQIGRTASAWAGFRDVAAAASAAGQADRETVARARAAAIEPKLSRLRISVPEEAMAPGLEVQRDGVVVASLIWGTDVPVDPGKHLVSASAPGREPWSATIDVTEPGRVVVLRVPPLAAKGPLPPPPAPVPRPPPKEEGRSAIPAVLLGTLAAGGIVGGAVLLVMAGKKGDEAAALRGEIGTNGGKDDTCAGPSAPPKCAALDAVTQDQVTWKGLAAGAFVGGGLAAAGLFTYVLWPSSEAPSRGASAPSKGAGAARLSLTVSPGPGGGSLVAAGVF